MSRTTIFIATLALFLSPSLASAAANPKSLIKLADDSAVYYFSDDGKRYVFPNSLAYKTWYQDYGTVSTVEPSEMASIPLGGNVTYRPGARMIKIVTDPKTYAVDRGGVLRWVKSEAVAVSLYGLEWNKKIDDVPDAFFVNYRLGAPIESASDFNPEAVMSANADIASDIGARAMPSPSSDQSPGTVTASLPVDAASSVVIQGAQGVVLGRFILHSNGGASAVKSVTVQGYIDEAEGNGDFVAGSDDDNATTSFLRDHVQYVSLYDDTGTRLAGPINVLADGLVKFDGFTLSVAKDASRTIVLKGDIAKNADLGSVPDVIAFDLVDSTGIAGPNGATAPKNVLTIKKSGRLTTVWAGGSGGIIAGREVELGALTFKAEDDDFQVRTVSFAAVNQPVSLSRVSIDVPKSGGASAIGTASSENVFGGLAVDVPRGQTAVIRVFGQLNFKVDGAIRGEKIKIDFLKTLPFLAVSKTVGDSYSETSFGSSEFPLTSTASDFVIRFTNLTVSRSADSPVSTERGLDAVVMRFTVKAEPDDAVRIRKMSFKISPSDAGGGGADNDALERWADANGDIFDDNNVVTLRSPSGNFGEVIGEGFDTTIAYGIYHGGAEDTTPQGLDSAVGDYAIVRYTWDDGRLLKIFAGETRTFQLELDTSKLALGPQSVSVELLGAVDFEWIDSGVGSPTVFLDGSSALGLTSKTDALSVP